jgi:hypothetical protein
LRYLGHSRRAGREAPPRADPFAIPNGAPGRTGDPVSLREPRHIRHPLLQHDQLELGIHLVALRSS